MESASRHPSRWAVLLAVAACSATQIRSQVTTGGTQITVVQNSLDAPSAVAIDSKETLYIADSGNGRVVSTTLSAQGSPTLTTVLDNLSNPQGLVLDWVGNLYISDTGNGRILMLPATNGGLGSARTVASGLSNPAGLAVDLVQNLYIAESGNNRILKLPFAAGSFGAAIVVGTGFSNPMGVAVDPNLTLYIADTGNGRVMKQVLTAGSYPTQQVVFQALASPTAVTVDSSFNVTFADTGNGRVIEIPWNPGAGRYNAYFIAATGLNASGLGSDRQGNYFAADAAHNRVVELTTGSSAFGAVSPGSSSLPQVYQFSVTAGTSISGVGVFTQGVSGTEAGTEFMDAGNSSCSPQTYTAATVCGVNVIFSPSGSGTRYGAVVLSDPNGNPLATAYFSGVGLQPRATFLPGQTTVLGSGLSAPSGVAVDGAGNVFISDTGNDRVLELPWIGNAYGTQVEVPVTRLSNPMGLSVDGAGNLYIASNDNDTAIKLPRAGSGFGAQVKVGTGLYGPSCIDVDGSGNVFISSTLSNSLWKVPWTGSAYAVENQLGSYTKLVTGVAVNGIEDVYFTEPYMDVIGEVQILNGVNQGETSLQPSRIGFPAALALDPDSNLYIADSLYNQVFMLPWTGSGFGKEITIASGFNAPAGITVDRRGVLYVADTGNNRIVKIDLSTPASQSFANTNLGATSTDSPRTVQIQNMGNMPLTLSAMSFPPDFPLHPQVSNTCLAGSTLGVGAGCVVPIDFIPAVPGSPLQESVNITNNSPVSGSQRAIPVSGAALARSSQTIAFPAIAGAVYGASNVVLGATASSGLPVTYSVLSGPAVLTGAKTGLTINGVGTVVVQAAQAGNSAFSAAATVTISFPVTPATLTVTPVNVNAVYGVFPASFNYTIAGYVNGQTMSQALTGKPLVQTNATSKSGAGTYTLTASLGSLVSANYIFKFVTGTLTINKAVLVVRANSLSSTYGSVLPNLTWSLGGFVNGDTANSVTGSPSVTTLANSGSPVGTYAITATTGSLSAANYQFQFTPGVMTILQAPLVLAASNQTIVYGTGLPQLTWSITGLREGDTQGTALRGLPVLATTASPGPAVGTYVVTIAKGTLTATNYSLTFKAGTLTVTPASLTVSAANLTMKVGAALPALTYSIAGVANGDALAIAASGAPSLTTTATSSAKAGTYAIVVAKGTMKAGNNYLLTVTNGLLTVTQ